MKKFLSIFIALAMVLSLFAGVGARSAKAASTLTVTPSGSFTGGVDALSAAKVNAVGTITTIAGSVYTVNVTTVGVGKFYTPTTGTPYNVSASQVVSGLTPTSSDADWATAGNQVITFSATTDLAVGDVVTCGTGVGTILSFFGAIGTATEAYVNVTTAGDYGTVSVKRLSFKATTSDVDWYTLGSQDITLDTNVAGTAVVGDVLTVKMSQTLPATYAVAYLTLGGVPAIGDVVTATWQGTDALSYTASFTATAATLANVLAGLTTAINAKVLGTAETVGTSVIKMYAYDPGIIGNGKTLTASVNVASNSLTIQTLGGLTSPAYVEVGKTIKLVATDSTGAVVPVTYTMATSTVITLDGSATTGTTGLVLGLAAGVQVVTAIAGSATGQFVVVVIAPQVITSLAIKLVPAVPVSITKQQFGAIGANAGYIALDYTTNAVWADTLPVASIAAVNGLLTYSTDETGPVTAYAAGITTTASVKIATGVVTIVTVVAPTTRVIVLTVGTDIVTVDGKATSVDAAPEIVNGRTFVPIRFIAETFGSTVTWLPETRGVTIVLGGTTIGLQIGNKTVVINGNIIAVEAAPYIKNSRTMVPLRVISESFGGDVAWDPALRTITITYVLPVVPAA